MIYDRCLYRSLTWPCWIIAEIDIGAICHREPGYLHKKHAYWLLRLDFIYLGNTTEYQTFSVCFILISPITKHINLSEIIVASHMACTSSTAYVTTKPMYHTNLNTTDVAKVLPIWQLDYCIILLQADIKHQTWIIAKYFRFSLPMGLLTDTPNCELRMPLECRERPHPLNTHTRAWHTFRDACRGR